MSAFPRDRNIDDEYGISYREADDYVEQRRQKEILDAAHLVLEIDQVTESEFERGEIDLETRQAELRTAVRGLILEIEHMARRANAEGLLKKEHIHTVEISPPMELIHFVATNEERIVGGHLKPKEVASIDGLLNYLTAPHTFSATWEVQLQTRHEGTQPISQTATTRMPEEASQEAFRKIRGFLSNVDLDLGAKLEDYDGGEVPGL